MEGSTRVLIAHDYLTQRGGAERVALSMLNAFPGSALLTSIYNPATTFAAFADHDVRTLWTNRVPAFREDPRRAFPVLASAFGSARENGFDVVVCSSSGWSHGLGTDAPKVVYCHTPARWLYEVDDYLDEIPTLARPVVRALLPPLRRWDGRAAASVDTYLANSTVVRQRIESVYGVAAEVLRPPVALNPTGDQVGVPNLEPGFLLTVSRSRGYKNLVEICLAVEALGDQRLVVVGDLPNHPDGRPWSPRLTSVSRVPDAQLRWLYAQASGLIAVGREDFGLTPIEAFSFGTPAVLLRAGGYLDSHVEGVTGVFVENTTVGALTAGVAELTSRAWDEGRIRQRAGVFGEPEFQNRLRSIVAAAARRSRLVVQS